MILNDPPPYTIFHSYSYICLHEPPKVVIYIYLLKNKLFCCQFVNLSPQFPTKQGIGRILASADGGAAAPWPPCSGAAPFSDRWWRCAGAAPCASRCTAGP